MPRKDATTGQISAQAQQDLVSEGIENFELPKSVVTKIAKSAIPDNAKLQKETILSLVKGSTVFINYLGTAHDVALSKQHKSISASDVLKALEHIEFGDLVESLQSELQVYRELAKTDKSKKGSANVNNSNAQPSSSTSASAPPNAKKAGSSGSSAAQQRQSSASVSSKSPLLPRKNKGTVAASAPVPASILPVEDNDDDVDMGMDESASSAPHVQQGGGEDEYSEGLGHVDQDEQIEEDEQDEPGDEEEEGEHRMGEEELVDMMQVEEEELRRDARGVEEQEED
ncbi:Histone-fold-containing protein [Amanita muscaria]